MLTRQSGAGGERQGAADQGRRGGYPQFPNRQMESAALAAGIAARFAENFRQHSLGRGATRQQVAVVAPGREYEVVLSQRCAGRHRGRILPNVDMVVPGKLLGLCELNALLFKSPNTQHRGHALSGTQYLHGGPRKIFSTNLIPETATSHGAAAKILDLLALYVGFLGEFRPQRHLPRNQRPHLRRRRAPDISAQARQSLLDARNFD